MTMTDVEKLVKLAEDVEAALLASPPPALTGSDEQIKHMVSRFLGWRLPDDFRPDGGVTFKAEFNEQYMASLGKPPMRHQPSGTNLLDATQAEAMIRYIVAGLPSDHSALIERVKVLEEGLTRIIQHYEARSELYTNNDDLADGLYDIATSTLSKATEGDNK